MENRKYITVVFALLTSTTLLSQIVTKEEPEKKEEKKKEVVEKAGVQSNRELDNQTSVYFNTNWSNTSRNLSVNEGLFAEEIGERANEVNSNFWSFGIGIRADLKKNFRFSTGLGLVRNGEKYSFIGEDSTFSYTTRYNYVSMPLILDYVRGNDLKFSIGVGLMPQMLLNYRQEQEWENSVNTKSTNTIKLKGTDQNFNPFIISAVVNAGIQYKYGNFWSIYFTPEARFQIPSTYVKNYPYVQKAVAIGFNLGLSYQL
jgi:Na+-transporting methylmalonyl-CoA/oxaloacetate decarboxylase gamma subunit